MNKTGQAHKLDFLIPSDPAEGRRVQEEIEGLLHSRAFTEQEIFGIRLALEEALVNAMKHGNGMDRTKKVHVSVRIDSDRFEAHIVDEGNGFNPDEVPDPTAIENLERPCGRGLMLMRYYMTEVAFSGRGNAVSLIKLRNGTK